MKITYSKCGDYQIQNLAAPSGNYQIGKYGNLRRTFLKEHYYSFYSFLLMNGTLLQHLVEIDEICHRHMKDTVSAMAAQEGVNEQLKADDQMEWVRRMNSIKNRAEEIVLKDYVYGGFEK